MIWFKCNAAIATTNDVNDFYAIIYYHQCFIYEYIKIDLISRNYCSRNFLWLYQYNHFSGQHWYALLLAAKIIILVQPKKIFRTIFPANYIHLDVLIYKNIDDNNSLRNIHSDDLMVATFSLVNYTVDNLKRSLIFSTNEKRDEKPMRKSIGEVLYSVFIFTRVNYANIFIL